MRKLPILLLAALFAALLLSPSLAGHPGVLTATITGGGTSSDNTTSSVVKIPAKATNASVYVPTLTSSTVYLMVSGDGGTTYAEYRSTPNGTNMILTGPAAGTTAHTFDVPGGVGGFTHLKIKCGTEQAADRTFKVFFW